LFYLSTKKKLEKVVYHELLQPLPLSGGTWKNITMDFIESLPKSEGKDTIMVVLDQFLEYAYFIVLTYLFSTQDVARTFLDHFYKFHELLTLIMIDRDKIFISLF